MKSDLACGQGSPISLSKSMRSWACGNQELQQVESVWSSTVCKKNNAFGALKSPALLTLSKR